MPLAAGTFKPYGLEKWQVVDADPASGYTTVCLLTFKDKESADTAFKNADKVMADVPNYTDAKPLFVGGQVVGGN